MNAAAFSMWQRGQKGVRIMILPQVGKKTVNMGETSFVFLLYCCLNVSGRLGVPYVCHS